MRRADLCGFALYEVLLGLAIFAIGVISLGRAVGNCMTANAIGAEDTRVRNILANRMAEIEATPGVPDKVKLSKIDTGYGKVELQQNAVPEELNEDGASLSGITRVTLTAKWSRGNAVQTKHVAFYVYRAR